MNRLLIIGGASLDTLHLYDRTVATAGGVGMYTAMAAHRCGADVSMMGPRPDPCPDCLLPVTERLAEWIGPVVVPEQLPRFEISYKSGKTEYLDLFFGAAQSWSLDMLPSDLSKYDLAHVAQKSDTAVQLAFVAECRERGVRLVSAGTYPEDAQERSAAVRAVIEAADIFFMNKREATAVFGTLEAAVTDPGKLLFITLGVQGALAVQGQVRAPIPAVLAQELDPTGAGDTFCGATLAFLLQGEHPLVAAGRATALAAEMIAEVGPAALFSKEPPPPFTG